MSFTIWGVTIVVSVLLEALTVYLMFIWVAIGALAALICSLLGFSSEFQLVVFTVFSVLSFVLLYTKVKEPYQKFGLIRKRIERRTGKLALCTDDITYSSGQILVSGVYYPARVEVGKKITKGSMVRLEKFTGEYWEISFVNLGVKDIPTKG